MIDLKSKAKAAFEHSKALLQVFATSDGETFANKTDAKLHATENKLEDKTITSFTRDEANDVITLDAEGVVISNIEHAKTADEVYQLVRGWTDTREAVVAAARERMEEIKDAEGK